MRLGALEVKRRHLLLTPPLTFRIQHQHPTTCLPCRTDQSSAIQSHKHHGREERISPFESGQLASFRIALPRRPLRLPKRHDGRLLHQALFGQPSTKQYAAHFSPTRILGLFGLGTRLEPAFPSIEETADLKYPRRLTARARLTLTFSISSVTKQDIEDLFSGHGAGTIKEIKLMNGFGFIEYEDAMDARDVVPGE